MIFFLTDAKASSLVVTTKCLNFINKPSCRCAVPLMNDKSSTLCHFIVVRERVKNCYESDLSAMSSWRRSWRI